MNMDLYDLIQRRLSGTLTEDEASALQAALKSDAQLRRVYLDYMNLDAALASKAASDEATRELIVSQPNRMASRWLSWRPLTAAAAGIVFGMLCSSVVYGLVTQRQAKTQILYTEGFEVAGMIHDRGVPWRMDVWSGDLQAPQVAEGDVKPAEGLRMVTLPPVEKRQFSYAFRFVDLTVLPPMSAGQTREIEVTAQFYGAEQGVQDRFQIRLAAFADDAAGAREIWVRNHVDEQALLHVAKTVRVPPNAAGWTTVRSTMDVPAGARLLLVSLAAGVVDANTPKTAHYLDDVNISLITHETPQP